ncbi:xylose transporter, sodium:galactoside symporter family [Clostridioides difficile]|uniref:MFS transporter n=1 Tax=Clostridioides difficile TaxID=1496 RepID=UPI000D1FCE96|nr:MFS transporter [Clostridioides difficile]EGT2202443.1 MFS transporter [Clostridioides difficile]EGT4668541.1 MFS transporter [Clostridioides difficile]UWD40874.1 MFS transporter [Clostridioides difficile]UWD44658.1 MFS transporter [Clostridioides difficile]VFC60143.1 xylose transporter, sodium:galactoside symporter family [Clostridioides difficile]
MNKEVNVKATTVKYEKISFFERVSYGCGDLGCNIIYSAMSAFLLFYYTNYADVSAAAVGSIMLISRILDGFSDLTMGIIVDRTKSKYGKARPWILRMAIPFAIAAILLFSVPSSLGVTSKLIYIFITYNLVSTVIYTAINVPYATLNSLITQDQYERGVLSIFRMILATCGTLIINGLTLPLVEHFGNNLSAWTKTFFIFGIASIIVFFITFTGTKERVKAVKQNKNEVIPFKIGIKSLFRNKYWIQITLCLVCIFIVFAINGGSSVYYAKFILGDEKLFAPINMVSNVSQIIAMFMVAPFIKKFGKRNVLIVGSIILISSNVMFIIAGQNYIGVISASAIKGIGSAGIAATMFAIVSDTIEYGEWKTGYRTEGLINSASSFGFKVGNGLGSAILGGVLSIGGYVGTSATQSNSAIVSIKACFIYLPIFITILQIIIMFFYKLDKEYSTILNELNTK